VVEYEIKRVKNRLNSDFCGEFASIKAALKLMAISTIEIIVSK